MFDLYQYLLRFGAARLAKWKPDFLHPDVFARAVKQIHRIPWGGRAASPTDRLTVLATNHASPLAATHHLLCPIACIYYTPTPLHVSPLGCMAHLVVAKPPYQGLNIFVTVRSIHHHNKKSKRERIFHARSTSMLQPREYNRHGTLPLPLTFSHLSTSTSLHPREYLNRSSSQPPCYSIDSPNLLTRKDARYRKRETRELNTEMGLGRFC